MQTLEPRYTVEEVAKRYKVVPATVCRWIKRGQLGALDLSIQKNGHRYAIRPEDLEVFEEVRSTIRPGPKQEGAPA